MRESFSLQLKLCTKDAGHEAGIAEGHACFRFDYFAGGSSLLHYPEIRPKEGKYDLSAT